MSDITAIAVPKWGIEMVEGTINVWNKTVGDTVAKGDEILEMESDKIVNVWESPADGVLRRVLVEEGEARPVGALLGVIAAANVDDASIDSFIADFGGSAPAAEDDSATDNDAPVPAAAANAGPAETLRLAPPPPCATLPQNWVLISIRSPARAAAGASPKMMCAPPPVMAPSQRRQG
ncbi:biotin/lipoyl-containing protein [Halioglobus japonicus]|uniref:biotin/lipoyl-containing protein n=1 Tax=Halioglobus japonicus TaxID=930805 RepID=UPI001F0AB564|nr:biotin/lipoyl-containing protein [Halioglobus japonicus]